MGKYKLWVNMSFGWKFIIDEYQLWVKLKFGWNVYYRVTFFLWIQHELDKGVAAAGQACFSWIYTQINPDNMATCKDQSGVKIILSALCRCPLIKSDVQICHPFLGLFNLSQLFFVLFCLNPLILQNMFCSYNILVSFSTIL